MIALGLQLDFSKVSFNFRVLKKYYIAVHLTVIFAVSSRCNIFYWLDFFQTEREERERERERAGG